MQCKECKECTCLSCELEVIAAEVPKLHVGAGLYKTAGAVQCSAVQCSAVQCSAVQCNAMQYSVKLQLILYVSFERMCWPAVPTPHVLRATRKQ